MKYFTPDLLERYGSSDPAVFKPAEAEWENRCERYNAYLDSLKADLPPGLRDIEENYFLHDAVICGMGRHDSSFLIMLQLDHVPYSLVIFTYDLVGEPTIKKGVIPPEDCTPENHVEWQYDELERVSGDPATWVQSILLSNGWEVCLRFRDVRVQAAQPLIPAPRKAQVLSATS